MVRRKLTIVSYNFGLSVENYIQRQAKWLESYYDIKIVTGNLVNLEVKNITEYTSNWNKICSAIFLRRQNFRNREAALIITAILRTKPDIILFHSAYIPVKIYRLWNWLAHIPIVIIHHGTDINRASIDKEYQFKLRRLVTNENVKQSFVSYFLSERARSYSVVGLNSKVNYLGVDDFESTQRVMVNRKEGVNIVSVGRLEREKGFIELVNQLSILKKRGLDFVCRIFGSGSQIEQVSHSIIQHGLQMNVVLMGNRSNKDVQRCMLMSDVFMLYPQVVSSNDVLIEEALGLSFVEACCASLPLIGHNVGGVCEVIEDGLNGLLIEKDALFDFDTIERISSLLKNPNELLAYGSESRRVYEHKHYMQEKVHSLVNFINE